MAWARANSSSGSSARMQPVHAEINAEIACEIAAEIAEIGEGAKPAASIKRAASVGPVRPYPYPYP